MSGHIFKIFVSYHNYRRGFNDVINETVSDLLSEKFHHLLIHSKLKNKSITYLAEKVEWLPNKR